MDQCLIITGESGAGKTGIHNDDSFGGGGGEEGSMEERKCMERVGKREVWKGWGRGVIKGMGKRVH